MVCLPMHAHACNAVGIHENSGSFGWRHNTGYCVYLSLHCKRPTLSLWSFSHGVDKI